MRSCLRLIIAAAALSGCLQTENSSSLDAIANGTPEYLVAVSIMQNKCAGCHDFHTRSEDELIDAGEIIPASPETSPLYYRLRNSTGAQGPKTMPPSGPLSADELDAFVTWIQGIAP